MKKLGKVLLVGSFGSVFVTSYGKCCCKGDEKSSSKGGSSSSGKPVNKMDEVKDLFLKCFKLELVGAYTPDDVIVVKKEGSSVDDIINNKLTAEERKKLWKGVFHKVGDVVYMIGLIDDNEKITGTNSDSSNMLVDTPADYTKKTAFNDLDKGFYVKNFRASKWDFYYLKDKKTK